MKWWLIIILCLIFHNGYSQRKKAVIKQLTDIIEIDGFLNDKAWEDATVIEDFVGYQPVSGIDSVEVLTGHPHYETALRPHPELVGQFNTTLYLGYGQVLFHPVKHIL